MNNEIKSQDDLNRQGRESDVLIATIMKCQELVRKNVELEDENKMIKDFLRKAKGIITVYRASGNQKTYSDMEISKFLICIDEVLKCGLE